MPVPPDAAVPPAQQSGETATVQALTIDLEAPESVGTADTAAERPPAPAAATTPSPDPPAPSPAAYGAEDDAERILRETTLGALAAATGSTRLRNRVSGTALFDLPVADFRTDAFTERAFRALPAFGGTTWDELVMRVGAYRRQVLAGGDPMGVLRPLQPASGPVAVRAADVPDITLAELVRTADASARLTNCTHRSSLFNDNTVDDLLSGRLSEAEVLRVPELGRTSLRELLRLAEDHAGGRLHAPEEAAVPSERARPPAPHALQGRRVADLADHVDLPVRIANRLRGEPGLAEMPLADIWSDPDEAYRRLRQLEGLGRHSISDLIAFVQRLGVATADEEPDGAGSDVADEERADDPPGPAEARSATPPRELMRRAVDALSEKHRFVLKGRYGLGGEPARTLEEMGRMAHVTRERVRQVEKKALGILGKRPWREGFEACLAAEGARIWETLAHGAAVVPFAESGSRATLLDPWRLLAIDVVHGGVRGWLRAEAVESQAGWLPPGRSADDLDDAARVLEDLLSTSPLPRPFDELCAHAGLTQEAAEAALHLLDRARVHEGYLHRGHLGSKARRAARLHRMALGAADAGVIDVWRLAELDEAADHEDDRSPRTVLTQMGENPHLFHHLVDHWWLVLPRTDAPARGQGRLPETADTPLPRRADPGSLGSWLHDTLEAAGPLRHVDLRDQVRSAFPDVSAASVGPTLLGNPAFLRAAPGAWDVRGARRAGAGPALLTNRHARTYARAVRSGQGRGLYPAWTPAFEHAICVWARNEAEGDVFRSLLHVADPATWPVPDGVRSEWRRLRQLHGRWTLPAERHRSLGEDPPTADEVLSGLALAAQLDGLGWVMAGRLAHAASGAQSSADLLALLAAAGALDAPSDWQLHHPATATTRALLAEIAAEKYAAGRLDWTRGVMARLLDLARSGAGHVGWAAPEEVRQLIDAVAAGGAEPGTAPVARPVAQALAGAEDLFGSDEWDQLFSGRD